MIKCLKVAMSCSILLAAAGIAAYAADPTPRQTQTPPQVARDTGIPYSSTPTPGPQAGGSTWIPSEQYQSAGSGETEQGSFYSKKGFGPNSLTPFVGDANIETPEFKAFLVKVEKA